MNFEGEFEYSYYNSLSNLLSLAATAKKLRVDEWKPKAEYANSRDYANFYSIFLPYLFFKLQVAKKEQLQKRK